VVVDRWNPEQQNWKVLIPESLKSLILQIPQEDFYSVVILTDAAQNIQYGYDGKESREIKLPALGTASGLQPKDPIPSGFYTFTSLYLPPTIFKYLSIPGNQKYSEKVK